MANQHAHTTSHNAPPNHATASNGTVTPRANPTTAYIQVCSNCGFATFMPNPNITAARALGRATMFPPALYAGQCPHCNNGAMVNATITLP